MIYESSYESGRRPFVADIKRGYWSKANDFIYAGLSFGFRLDLYALSWITTVESGVSGFFPTYLISLAFYVVPLLVVKSFMGQFSNSGFVSALRLCPLFKGAGYVTLFLNICVLIYYSVFAIIPLVYLFASFKPTLPWGCDGIRQWTQEDVILCPTVSNSSCQGGGCYMAVASSLYFINIFEKYNVLGYKLDISWQVALCAICVWTLIAVIVYLMSSMDKISQLIRYSVQFVIIILLVFIARFSFLPGTIAHYERIFKPKWEDFVAEISKLPAYGICAFGPGWGLFITLASFNKFKTNITRSSWLIGIGQMFIIFGLDMLEKFINLHLKASTEDYFSLHQKQYGTFFLTSGTSLASLEWPNFWCILFYSMFFVASIVIMILQLHSILSSVFDEYTSLRAQKVRYSFYLIVAMAVCSLYFSSMHGYKSSMDLMLETFMSQSLINLLLILMVLWIYGRVRFQRDILFMTNERFATWKIYILRFVAPLSMVAVLIATIFFTLLNSAFNGHSTTVFGLLRKNLPWWSIPGYMIYIIYRSRGSLKERLIKCCRPTDWYPVEAVDRLRYEEVLNDSNMTHPLTEMKWDDDAFDVENMNGDM